MNIKLVPKYKSDISKISKISKQCSNLVYTDGTKIPIHFISLSRIDGYPMFEIDIKIPTHVTLKDCVLENNVFEFESVELVKVLEDNISYYRRDKEREIVDLILQSFGLKMTDLKSDESFDAFMREIKIKFLE